MCTTYIKKHILELPPTQIFTTREMLQYGLRGAVDQCLRRLVDAGKIIRLAGGVFVSDDSLHPSLLEITTAKMKAWNKSVYIHAENLLIEIGLLPPNTEAAPKLAVDSHSSSFTTIMGRIQLKGIGSRRARLCETFVGRTAYALWHLTEKVCREEHVSKATENFKRTDREDFRLAAAMMPAWLSDLCRFRFPTPRVVVERPFTTSG